MREFRASYRFAPYQDMFLMNLMLAAGGFQWTVIPVEERDTYMAALEEASVQQNIGPLVEFIARFVEAGLKGESTLFRPHPTGVTH